MDHIPRPANAVLPLPEIPYLGDLYASNLSRCVHSGTLAPLCPECQTTWQDGAAWNTFPERMGLDKTRLLKGDFTLHSTRQTLTHTPQEYFFAWVYFGSLHMISLETADLTLLRRVKDDGVVILDTTHLTTVLDEIKAAWLEQTEDDRDSAWPGVAAWINTIGAISNDPKFTMDFSEHAMPALGLLAEAIVMRIYEVMPRAVFLMRHDRLEQQVRALHWFCPSELARMRMGSSATTMYFATLLGERGGRTHEACSEIECVADNTNEDDYKVRHVLPDCKCEPVVALREDLIEALARDEVPLFTYDESYGLRLETPSPEQPYIAISHIWADGLGNPLENALPGCQISIVQAQVDQLLPSDGRRTPFFFDTLSVPVRGASTSRKRAIQLMDALYAGATMVLVRDWELEGVSVLDNAPSLLFRVVHSRWASRLWTLSEGRQAKKLVVCFGNGWIDVMTTFLQMCTECPDFGPLQCAVAERLGSLMALDRGETTSSEPSPFLNTTYELFEQTAAEVAKRSTSHQRDELLCFARLLGMPPEHVAAMLDHTGDAQAVAFLNALGKVPSSLIMVPGPRLEIDGYRWCHKRLTKGACFTKVGERNHLYDVTPDGLQGLWFTTVFSLDQEQSALFLSTTLGLRVLCIKTERLILTVKLTEDILGDAVELHGTMAVLVPRASNFYALRGSAFENALMVKHVQTKPDGTLLGRRLSTCTQEAHPYSEAEPVPDGALQVQGILVPEMLYKWTID